MELVRLNAADLPAVRALFLDVFTGPPWNDDWSDGEQLNAYLNDLTQNKNSLALGLMDKGMLVALSLGSIRHWYSGTEYSIDELCVARAYQGKGVGTEFLAQIEKYLLAHNIVHIFLQTERYAPAYDFYKKRGFCEMPEHVSFSKRLK